MRIGLLGLVGRLRDCQGDISDTGLGQDGSRLLQIDRG